MLHFYWDGLVFNDAKEFAQVEAKVQALLRDARFRPDQFPELTKTKDFLGWAQESLELAKTGAYRTQGTADSEFLAATPLPITKTENEQRKILKGLSAPLLSPQYQEKATQVAERRIVLAGYRLAEQLKAAIRGAK